MSYLILKYMSYPTGFFFARKKKKTLENCFLNFSFEGRQDGRGVGRNRVHLSPQRCQEYIFRCRGSHREPAEYWQESLIIRKENRVSCKTWQDEGRKQGAGRRVSGTGSVPSGWVSWSRRDTCMQVNQLGQKGKHLRVSESEAADLWQSEWTENHRNNSCCGPTYPEQGDKSTEMHRGWEQEHGDWRAIPRQGQLLTVERWPEGMGARKSVVRSAFGGVLGSYGGRVLSHCKGWSHHGHLSLPTH